MVNQRDVPQNPPYTTQFLPTYSHSSKLSATFQRKERLLVLQQYETSHRRFEAQPAVSFTLNEGGGFEFCVRVHGRWIEQPETHACVEQRFDGVPYRRLVKEPLFNG